MLEPESLNGLRAPISGPLRLQGSAAKPLPHCLSVLNSNEPYATVNGGGTEDAKPVGTTAGRSRQQWEQQQRRQQGLRGCQQREQQQRGLRRQQPQQLQEQLQAYAVCRMPPCWRDTVGAAQHQKQHICIAFQSR